ncbi:glycerol-3-phosphate acyltransferase [Clostridia bacterium]|nr:glycerol-3-phosphate acyltransferase [Clostridia bacterium]
MSGNFFIALTETQIPVWALLVACVAAYFAGNINPAILLGKARGIDIRAQGSGNAGATNAARSLGKKAGLLTFVIDILKGWIVCFLAGAIGFGLSSTDSPDKLLLSMLCGFFVILGHMWPVTFGFKGGKGVSTTFGVLLFFNPIFALSLFGIVIIVTLIFRRVSLSVLIAVAFALVVVWQTGGALTESVGNYDVLYFVFNTWIPIWTTVIFVLIIWKHRSNIARLVRGQESKLSFGGKK